MKIVRIETYTIHEAAVVRILTDDGLEGIGQTGCYQAEIRTDILHKLVAPHFLGKDPWQHQALLHECLNKRYKFFGSFFYRALCGIDTALYDLFGKATRQSVCNLLGGAVRKEIPMYASSHFFMLSSNMTKLCAFVSCKASLERDTSLGTVLLLEGMTTFYLSGGSV
jgi:L-alanine-DL-glutamate epimerase-like enolase superfamily enzyme